MKADPKPPAELSAISAKRRSDLTFRFDQVRGACTGVLETGWTVFALLIAVRVFDASPLIKALLVAAVPLGHLLSPFSLHWTGRTRLPPSRLASRFWLGAGLCLIGAPLAGSAAWFTAAVIAGAVLATQQTPFMLAVYAQNYAADRRGRLFSRSILFSVVAGGAFAFGTGQLLDRDMDRYPLVFGAYILAALIAAAVLRRIPSKPLPARHSRNPLGHLSYAWRDRDFGVMLFIWMLMGLGNLLSFPLRVEYMANPDFGINATNAQIALATAVIPAFMRLGFTQLWGWLFDRYDFFIIRTVLNGWFLAAILVFFNAREFWTFAVGGAMFGIAISGSNLAWNLWVTKFTSADKASDYMSVHTFFTGVRGVVAPFVGFYLISRYSPGAVSWISAGLIGLSILLLNPMRKKRAPADG